jgi:hypothetical protein
MIITSINGILSQMKISWAELRRRKVVRVVIAYVIGAWLLMQIGETLFGLLEVPAWAGKALVVTLMLGLPLAVILSWVFDITPEGVVATDADEPPPPRRFEFSELGSIRIEQLDLGRTRGTGNHCRKTRCSGKRHGWNRFAGRRTRRRQDQAG